MGNWQDKIVYFRDFAYTNSRRRIYRMASAFDGNIGDAPARTFAEYVDPPASSSSSRNSAGNSGTGSDGSVFEGGLRRSSFSRPPLTHRFNSHNLNVQAYAKSLRKRLLSGPLVDVYVGEGRRHWSLHQNLLCHHSPYLHAELQPSLGNSVISTGSPNSKKRPPPPEKEKEKENAAVELLDEDPAGFELLVKWLYQGKLEDVSSLDDPNEKYNFAVACHKLHLISDRFEMPALKNLAIDQYRKGLLEAGLVPDAEEMNTMYRRSAPGSPFRKLITRIAARQLMDPDSEKDAESYRGCFEGDPDFAIDLFNAIKLNSGGLLLDDPTEGNECEYHDHDNGPDCHIKGKRKRILGTRQTPRKQSPPPSPPSTPPRSRTSSPPKLNGTNAVTNGLPIRPKATSPPGSRQGRSPGASGRKQPPKLRRKSKSPDAIGNREA